MEINNSDEKIKVTEQWLKEKYNELNTWLFNGELDKCLFEIFTTGKGSQGRFLGTFFMQGSKLKYNKTDRRIYQLDYWEQEKTYVNKKNFFYTCLPTISINGNYSATEYSHLATLLHEMCHYYTYMNGYFRRQSHGVEFKRIAEYVSSKSNGLFSVQRIATAEEMNGRELDKEIKDRNDKRMENKMKKLHAIVVFTKKGEIQLTLTSNEQLLAYIIDKNYKGLRMNYDCDAIFLSNDINLIETLFNMGFRKNMRSYRWWELTEDVWNEISHYNFFQAPREIDENRDTNYFKMIAEDTVNELLNNKNDDVDITPNMVLSNGTFI